MGTYLTLSWISDIAIQFRFRLVFLKELGKSQGRQRVSDGDNRRSYIAIDPNTSIKGHRKRRKLTMKLIRGCFRLNIIVQVAVSASLAFQKIML